ncbi:OprO/OprP family phosphate-selective porin [Methylotenera sp.]|uniref:OprO/OprP family phosphate-selective porin n=1 Tax=Methylotenera sp. TaxID=2051956 RepID=UPI00272F87D4|nr:porin [Methylotenera sp.]MDP2071012.1 porin [Methylotenera sp.]MDP3005886.1 porin [Methylotenera sp.]
MNSNKLRGVIAAVAGAMLFNAIPAMADSTDDILNALIAKGVLTEEEGALLQKGRTGEKEAAAKKKESAISTSFKDGIVFESGDKKHKFSINGRAQADYRSFSDDVTHNQTDTWDIRRAYLGAKGSFYDTYDFEVTYNGAGSTGSDLLYAYANVRWWEQAQFKIGQFKQPFSMEELGSSRFSNFTERSLLTQLVPAIDRGAQVHGAPFKGTTYALGYFNGVGINRGTNANDNNILADGKSVTGRATVNIAEMMDNKEAVYHLGAAYSSTTDSDAINAIDIRTEGRGTSTVKTSPFTAIGTANSGYDLKRTGLEGAVAYGPVKLQGEWLKAKFEADGTQKLIAGGTAGDKDITAWYAAVNWMITGENYADVYKGGLFSGRMKPKSEFDPKNGKSGWGAWEIGARYSKLDASDFANGDLVNAYTGTGIPTTTTGTAAQNRFNEVDAWTLGLKWIPSPNTRLMLNYVKTNMDCATGVVCTEDSEKAVNLRAQVDF